MAALCGGWWPKGLRERLKPIWAPLYEVSGTILKGLEEDFYKTFGEVGEDLLTMFLFCSSSIRIWTLKFKVGS